MILGGAALNRRYVEQDLRAIYKGQLFYGEDAFDGLRIMDELAAQKKLEQRRQRRAEGRRRSRRAGSIGRSSTSDATGGTRPSSRRRTATTPNAPTCRRARRRCRRRRTCPTPPFLGSRVRTDFDVNEVFEYLNELTLFSTQWEFRRAA